MNNLKTLKDMEDRAYKVSKYALIEELRQEAIKWANNRKDKLSYSDWIIFFDITEEDLKQAEKKE